MISTISVDAIDKLMNKALEDYSKNSGLITMSVDVGVVAGIIQVINELDGFPKEKAEEYRNRALGIGELKSLQCK